MAEEILRPNGAGDLTEFSIDGSSPADSNWESVDEVTPDEGVTTVVGYADTKTDLYNIANPTFSDDAIINSVTLHSRCLRKDATYYKGWIGIKSGTTEDWGDFETLTADWTDYSREFTTDPDTAAAWTKAAITALQIGGKCPYDGPNQGMVITQTWVVVDYTEPVAGHGSSSGIIGLARNFLEGKRS